MKKLSTENLDKLPSPLQIKKLCQSISVLEAIICPEREFRYFSYQNNWSDDEEFCEMCNGQGDHLLILFQKNGICINGFAYESSFNGWENGVQKIAKGIVDKLPKQFNKFVFGEPVKSIGTTFCIWSVNNECWKIGTVELPKDEYKDGSEDLLALLDGNPITYKNWAEKYYEKELKIETIAQIYKGTLLTKKMVTEINPNFDNYQQLKQDLYEIGYDYDF